MTMTSVAVAPGSLGAPPSMLTPQMYHLQQGLSPTSGSPASGKVSRKKSTRRYIRFMEPLDTMRGRACRMRDASYAGVLHNGTKPRLKSRNLRGRLLRDAELWCGMKPRGSQGELFWCCVSPRGLIAAWLASLSVFLNGKSIDYFFFLRYLTKH